MCSDCASRDGDATEIDPFDPESCSAPDNMGAEEQSALENEPEGMTPELDLLVFDVGHVIVDFDWREVCKGFYTRSGHSADEFKSVMAHLGTLGYEHGRISTEDFVAELNEKAGLSLTVEEFKPLWTATFVENPEMAALLEMLQDQYTMYILSNTNEVHFEHLHETYDIGRFFQELILSYRVGHRKPEPEIYTEVLTRSQLPASRCLFVDDLAPNIQAAEDIGMHTIRFVGVDDLKARLRAFGIEV